MTIMQLVLPGYCLLLLPGNVTVIYYWQPRQLVFA